jgi:hypothetical protein
LGGDDERWGRRKSAAASFDARQLIIEARQKALELLDFVAVRDASLSGIKRVRIRG